ncbi:Phosphatidate cytidylyltransferase [Mycena sanguinolenta]|uniref:Phosphatidate cytidylyltransferase n=1 Tax=Mycena sanguinolenta TaxID=230812 RepID=A0A8H7DM21_9AGAR|nr:Phosphatidate cytidylyltransferase [Mycena sanguinolenta]
MSRLSVASKTTFDSLAVDSGEETEEEEIPVESTARLVFTIRVVYVVVPETEVKPTKTALKKAARAAKKLQQQQQQAKKAASRDTSSSDARSSSPSGSAYNPVEISHEVEKPLKEPEPAPLANGAATAAAAAPAAKVEEPIVVEATPAPEIQPPLPEPVAVAPEPTPSAPPAPVAQAPPPPQKREPPVVEAPAENPALAAELTKKRQNMLTRTIWTFIMIGTFLVLLLLGHAYMILLVMVCQTLVYREVTELFSLTTSPEEKTGKDPWSTTLNWYFFVVTNYFLYGESIIYYFKHVVFSDAQWLPFATNHRIISFTLYTIGFVGFVMSLQKGFLKQQFGLFGWVHMRSDPSTSHFIINNILEGLIWFWVPASLTVEGFVGAFWSTMIFGVIWGTIFMQFEYMICPVHDLGVSAWSSVKCTPNPVFVWREWQIWTPLAVCLSTLLGRSITTISYAPYQFHLLCMSGFASLVAPFGGFFASGFKRAFNIKDFGHSIPGHGGMTDRMDCQFLMGVFVYVYYSSLIREHNVTVGSVLQTIVSGLTIDQQLELVADLQHYLSGQGISIPCRDGLLA